MIKTLRVRVDGGVSPNACVPLITAEVRVFYPPYTVSAEQVTAALLSVTEAALDEIDGQLP